ncbi:MAG: hypothetical protein HQL96_09415 [Magnetococcales bacterium]|nr:hypothetical protein [Magnetococcales bacterium]
MNEYVCAGDKQGTIWHHESRTRRQVLTALAAGGALLVEPDLAVSGGATRPRELPLAAADVSVAWHLAG